MPKRRILVLQPRNSPWNDFLKEFFHETASDLFFFQDTAAAKAAFDKEPHEIVFADQSLISLPLSQALEVARQSGKEAVVFGTGEASSPARFKTNDSFPGIPEMLEFQKKMLKSLLFPEKIRVLIVDDEPEIGRMICDFLDRRVNPAFETAHAPNGAEGLRRILEQTPDVMVLDIKMPLLDGREVYREMRKKNINVPTIVFFDAVFGDELAEMRRYGKPAVIEKGAPQSALPELLELVKKMWFFC